MNVGGNTIDLNVIRVSPHFEEHKILWKGRKLLKA